MYEYDNTQTVEVCSLEIIVQIFFRNCTSVLPGSRVKLPATQASLQSCRGEQMRKRRSKSSHHDQGSDHVHKETREQKPDRTASSRKRQKS